MRRFARHALLARLWAATPVVTALLWLAGGVHGPGRGHRAEGGQGRACAGDEDDRDAGGDRHRPGLVSGEAAALDRMGDVGQPDGGGRVALGGMAGLACLASNSRAPASEHSLDPGARRCSAAARGIETLMAGAAVIAVSAPTRETGWILRRRRRIDVSEHERCGKIAANGAECGFHGLESIRQSMEAIDQIAQVRAADRAPGHSLKGSFAAV